MGSSDTWGPKPMPKAPIHMTVGKRCQFENKPWREVSNLSVMTVVAVRILKGGNPNGGA